MPHLPWAVLPIGLAGFWDCAESAVSYIVGARPISRTSWCCIVYPRILGVVVNATVSGIVSPLVSLSPLTLSAAVFAVSAGRIIPMAAERAIRRRGDASRRRG